MTSATPQHQHAAPAGRPFDLGDDAAYRRWRADKLRRFPQALGAVTVDVEDIARPSAGERAALTDAIQRANMVIYRCRAPGTDRGSVRAFGRALGLERVDEHLCADDDGVSELQVSDGNGHQADYIPYTDRPLSWHCDGYYNESARTIRAMLLHCARDAAEGGENGLVDHEMLYIALRDRYPEYLAALMHPEALTIPANVQDGQVLRPERTGPVFSVDPATGALHMRYTARGRNVRWRDDATTREAAARITQMLESEDVPVFRCRLAPGEGLLCNNVLHNRTGFRDDAEGGRQRLVYRVRFLDRVAET
ncbi:Taurine catabolism dioxygenase [Thioalkalivibrio nitratireducens DSM 14787]|uniref:Taurine catabolism dioxygenase n=1 Tax=Thioalkalivibrio nitratireducens (strain DSM 14787 / UNIQEM 213 / ALEN2) TaxID=1255043 RepID=L0DU65_THIND|nr:TauD/TfdA family dioxygenase [Thioalkalivibrio nitratireducens]AGA32552.1 Taurine catabolism dioxygenase [Thioalkalivibrio nitratireducens DSM 14787]